MRRNGSSFSTPLKVEGTKQTSKIKASAHFSSLYLTVDKSPSRLESPARRFRPETRHRLRALRFSDTRKLDCERPVGREAEAGEGARTSQRKQPPAAIGPPESHGHSGHSGLRTARRRISSDSCSRRGGRAVRSVPVPASAPGPAVAPSCGCGLPPFGGASNSQRPRHGPLIWTCSLTVLAVTGGSALTTSPESATASSQPGSPAASTSTPPQQSLVAPSAASSFHHHPRGRLVSRACDRCRRRKAKVSGTQCSASCNPNCPFLPTCLRPGPCPGPCSFLPASLSALLSSSSSRSLDSWIHCAHMATCMYYLYS